MNLNTANLKVGLAASKDPLRTHIQTIHVTKEYTEATNGSILARIGLPEQFDTEDLPGSISTKDANELEPFCIPTKAAMDIKTFKGRIPCLNDTVYIDVEKTNQNGNARFISTDLESTRTPEIQKANVDYPKTDQVFPHKAQPVFEAWLSVEELEKLIKIMKATEIERIKVKAFSVTQPILFTNEDKGKQTFRGLLMAFNEV
jgi:uncharacterized small protein (DUF1192 family)